MRCLEHRQCAEGVFQPSRTVTCVLLSASGTEWEIRILFLIKFYSGKKFLKTPLTNPCKGVIFILVND